MEVFDETETAATTVAPRPSPGRITEGSITEFPALETVSVLWGQLNEAFRATDTLGLEALLQVLVERVPVTLLEQTWLEDTCKRVQDSESPWTYADLGFALRLAAVGDRLQQPLLRSQLLRLLVETAVSEAARKLQSSALTDHAPTQTGSRVFAGLYRYLAHASKRPEDDPEEVWSTLVQLMIPISQVLGCLTPMHVDALALCVAHKAWTIAETLILAEIPSFWQRVPSPLIVNHEDLQRFLFDAATVQFMTGAYRAAWRSLRLFWALEQTPYGICETRGSTSALLPSFEAHVPVDRTIPVPSWFTLQAAASGDAGMAYSELRIRAAQRFVCIELVAYGATQDVWSMEWRARGDGRSQASTARFLARYRALAEAFQMALAANQRGTFEEFCRAHEDSFRVDGNEAWVYAVRLALDRLLILAAARAYTTLPLSALSERIGVPARDLEQALTALQRESCWKQSAGPFWSRWYSTVIYFDAATQNIQFQRRSRHPCVHAKDGQDVKHHAVRIPDDALDDCWRHATYLCDASRVLARYK